MLRFWTFITGELYAAMVQSFVGRLAEDPEDIERGWTAAARLGADEAAGLSHTLFQARTQVLVRDMDRAVAGAGASGADILVSPFPDAIGRDAVIQWPGGVTMQLYWHKTAPQYAPLRFVPDNRVYVSPDRAAQFVGAFMAFSHGRIAGDDDRAPGESIGKPGTVFRRITITSDIGRMVVMVTDGQLPYPYGREVAGYGVADLPAALARARATGADMLVPPAASGPQAAMVSFPGGYVAEIHAAAP